MGIAEYSTADSVYNAMEAIHVALSSRYMIKKEFITPFPVLEMGEYQMVMVSPLLDNKRTEVGSVRAFIFAQENGSRNMLARIEWTMDAFGFWFRDDYRKKIDAEDPEKGVSSQWARSVIKKISQTANRNIPLKSQIRLNRKIKKNPVKDKALRSGLVMG